MLVAELKRQWQWHLAEVSSRGVPFIDMTSSFPIFILLNLATSKTWAQILDSDYGYGRWKTWTQKKLNPEKPGPGQWKMWETGGCRKMIRRLRKLVPGCSWSVRSINNLNCNDQKQSEKTSLTTFFIYWEEEQLKGRTIARICFMRMT